MLVFGFASADCGVPADWAADAATPGVNLLPDLSLVMAEKAAASGRTWRQPGDVLIASIHWGGNWGYRIPADQRRFAHALIDGGFDVVHGHSSHHPKGIEIYRRKLILYGCGDFINDYEGISGNEEYRGDLALMYIPWLDSETGCLRSLRLVPMQIRRFRLNRASPADATWQYRTIAKESAARGVTIGMQHDGSLLAAEKERIGMRLTSSAFASDSQVPVRFTCDGEDVSPPLAWTDPSSSAQSFALICSDPDAPGETWYHWAIYDIPQAIRSLDEHRKAGDPGARQAINDFGRKGYGGPCPPPGSRAHRYVFRLYALNVAHLDVDPDARCPEVEAAAKAHAIASAELVGLYARRRH